MNRLVLLCLLGACGRASEPPAYTPPKLQWGPARPVPRDDSPPAIIVNTYDASGQITATRVSD